MPKKKKARADGRLRGALYIGGGKYKYVYGKTPKEVNDKLAELRVQYNKGVDLTQSTELSVWIRRWLAREEQRMTPEWYATCASRAAVWAEQLGDRDVTKLTPADLEDVLLALTKRNPTTGKPSSKKTLVEYRNIISRIFAFLVQNRVLTFDPTKFLYIEKTAKKTKRDAISDAQIAALRNTTHEAQLPCLIMLYAGLRLGECCALTWSDVDLKNNVITVNKSYNFQSHAVKSPKTLAGNRTVPIPPPLMPFLLAAPRTALLVCPHNGGVYTRSAWRNTITQYSKALGFEVEAHCLRHTCCTLYYEAGIDVLTAQRWMGHADPQTTMSIYTHLREQKETAAVSQLSDFFSSHGSVMGQNTSQSVDK